VRRVLNALIVGLFLTSGFASLIYQALWQRLLTLIGGADIISVTIVVAAFMAGLGLGSLAGGYAADRLSRPACATAFALCECAVGFYSLFSAYIYYDLLYQGLGGWMQSTTGLLAVGFAVTLWPTFFMGMSLPLITRAATSDAERPAHWVPILYGWNTLGAACGSLATVAILVRSLDFANSLRVGALFSLACAIGGLAVARSLTRLTSGDPAIGRDREAIAPSEAGTPQRFRFRTWLAIYVISGFVALSLEILWFRIIGVVLKSNSFTFGYLLALYLGGVGLGALAASHPRLTAKPAAPMFLALQAAIPLWAALSLALFVSAVNRIDLAAPLWAYMGEYNTLGRAQFSNALGLLRYGDVERSRLVLLLYVGVPLWIMGPPTVMMGLSFGYLQRVVQTNIRVLGRRIGWLQAANIGGAMAGCLLTGLGLLDWLGSSGTIRLLVCATGFFLFVLMRTATDRRIGWMALAGAVASAVMIWAFPTEQTLWARLHAAAPESIIQAEGRSGLSVLKRRSAIITEVFANGLGESRLPYGGIHTILGALPALLHPGPIDIAVIGLGSGDTLFALGGRPQTRRIVCLEINGAELKTLRELDRVSPDAALRMLLGDPRITHELTDGRAYLRNGKQRYDIIEADALRPRSAYAGNLYSVEYFTLLRDHLNPGGLAVSWAPTPRIRDTFLSVFAHVAFYDAVGIGSDRPISVEPATLSARLSDPFTRTYYSSAGLDITRVLGPYLTMQPTVFSPADDRSMLVDLNRDLFPKDEFAVPYH
jgi:spermidine synthase